jgi:adenine phosphoribosyltransferase
MTYQANRQQLLSGSEIMSDKLDLKKHIRNVDDFPIPGIKFRDITSLIETPEPFRKTCKELTKITDEFSADFVVSIESRGFIFLLDL